MELDIVELKKLLTKARNINLKLDAITDDIFNKLNEADIDLDAETGAYNADNLSEAITCYVNYGEYDLDSLMDEIENQLKFKKKYDRD